MVLEVERSSLESLLPEGYVVDPAASCATMLFEVMELRNLPWLAGRGYNTFGIYFNDVICTRVTPRIKASYLGVLFENFTDPIVTGREELGFPKVFAEIPNALVTSSGTEGSEEEVEEQRVHTLSWDGYEFLRLELNQLTRSATDKSPSLNQHSRSYTHPTKDGILHQRYMPAVGEPGKADANYATFCPPPPNLPTVLDFKTLPQRHLASITHTSCPAVVNSPAEKTTDNSYSFHHGAVKLNIATGTFEKLPTLHNIVDGLATLKATACKEVALQEFKGASDLGKLPET